MDPITNAETYMQAILDGTTEGLPEPVTREEAYLKAIAENGGGQLPTPTSADEGKIAKVINGEWGIGTGGGSGATWGGIDGTLANQTDLQSALDDKADADDLAEVATSGDYDDLSNKPSIPSVTLYQSKVYKIDGVSILAEEAEKAAKDGAGNVIADTYLTAHQSLSAYRTSAAQDTIDDAIEADVDAIEAKIPAQATSSNQLADKDFVNSSVATNTANYISNEGQPFTSLAQLEAYTGTVTNNDYAFVTGTDTHGNSYYDRYKATVSGSTVTWANEYRLNNSSFTAAQWASISSGITAALVASYNSHIADTTVHVTSSDKTSWNGKVDSTAIDHETWTFTLDDSTTVTKEVVIWQ